MSARACVTGLVAEGKLDKTRAGRFLKLFDELEAQYRATYGEQAAAALASRDTIEKLEKDAAEAKRVKLMQLGAQASIAKALKAHVAEGGKAGQFLIGLLDHHEAVRGVSNISNRRAAVARRAWSLMNDTLARHHRDLLGRMGDAEGMRNAVREMFGQDTGDAEAKALAAAWGETAEFLRKAFNAAGGHIGRLERWGLSQSHNALAVGRAGKDAWKAFIRPLLDAARMTDGRTGRPFTAEGLDAALDEVFDTIESEGLNKLAPGAIMGSKVANRRADARFLHFKDADAWLAYSERFGSGDPLNAIVGHIDGMARDIAAMQILGPNPALTVRWLGQIVRRDAPPARPGSGAGKARLASWEVERMFQSYMGSLNRPVIPQVARFFEGLRNWNVGSKIGSTFLSAQTDLIYQGVNARFNGLSTVRILADYLKLLNPADPKHRLAARRMGLTGADMVAHAEKMRVEGAAVPFNLHELSRRAADLTVRTSLLGPWTTGGKAALSNEVLRSMADRAGKRFDQLDEAWKLNFEQYGITPASWEAIRATPIAEINGQKMLRPDEVWQRADLAPHERDELAYRIMEMIDAETRFAVPEAGLRAKAWLTLVPRGTGVGDVLHSMTQFKGFPVGAFFTHLSRMIWGRGSALKRADYAIRYAVGLTVMGAFIEQMYELFNGRDPRPMNDDRFWAAAALRGGAVPVIGDMLFSPTPRTGGHIAGYLTGPTLGGIIDPALRLAGAAGDEAREGRKSTLGREGVRFLEANTPLSNLWMTRAATKRLLWDNLQRMADPEAEEAFARTVRQRELHYGNSSYWQPGEPLPDRAPDLSTALEAGPLERHRDGPPTDHRIW